VKNLKSEVHVFGKTIPLWVILWVIAGIGVIAYATYTSWIATFTWTWQAPPTPTPSPTPVKQFTVTDEAGHVLSSPYTVDLGTVQGTQTFTYKFCIWNDGTVEITVNVVEVTETGCSGTWNAMSFTIPQGGYAEATLTLQVFAEGTYSFKFELAE
jgi:hypothetical protein